jgi:hypothetical protein
MYNKLLNKNGTTKHATECKMSFGRKDTQCHRCVELLNGDAPRADHANRAFKAEQENNHIQNIKNHNCEKSNCGAVCTAFEW